jgi:hypothetical protein
MAESQRAVMLYLISPSTPALRHMIRVGEVGAIVTPATGYRVNGLPVWAADNGCFSSGYPGDEAFARWLERHTEHAGRCLFAVAPDVVGDAVATLERSRPWLPVIRSMGYPVAFVLQNGQEHRPVPWDDIDAVFIGGDTAWKLGPGAAQLTREARDRGKHAHMGRVNGGRRMAYAAAIGCLTADGNCLTRAPDKNTVRLAGWYRQARNPQEVLF